MAQGAADQTKNQEHRGEPLHTISSLGSFICIHNIRNLWLFVHPKHEAIMVKCLALKVHKSTYYIVYLSKCHDRELNPHSADQKHQSRDRCSFNHSTTRTTRCQFFLKAEDLGTVRGINMWAVGPRRHNREITVLGYGLCTLATDRLEGT